MQKEDRIGVNNTSKEKLNILVVDQHYYPERFLVTDVSERLVSDGHSVTVLCGLPNYPDGVIPERYRHGKNREEWINGVHVVRAFEIGRRPGAVGLFINYLSFVLGGISRQYAIKEEFDVVFCYETSPVVMSYPGEVFAKRTKTPLFFYCCDIWPECAKVMKADKIRPLWWFISAVSKMVYKRADLLAVQSKGFYGYFEQVHHIKAGRLAYLPQFSDSSYLDMDFAPVDDACVDFVFMGNVGLAQDIDGLIEAAARLREEKKAFKVHVIGSGSYLGEARELVKSKGLEEVVLFYGRKPYEDMPNYYKLADVCLATLRAGSMLSVTIPQKVQGYMAAGKPIIAALSGYAREVVDEAGCGITVSPGHVEELASAMKQFIDHKMDVKRCGENARNYFREHFTLDRHMDMLYSLLEETINISGRRKRLADSETDRVVA